MSYAATGGKIANNGLYRANGTTGVYQVIARQNQSGLADTSIVTIVSHSSAPARVTVSPSNDSLPGVGATVQLTAQALDQSGATMTGQSFAWTSSNTSVATVSSAGLVTAMGPGSATITAAAGGTQGNASITVLVSNNLLTVTKVNVSPATASLTGVGATVQLTAQALDQNNSAMTGQTFTWTSSNTAVATVSSAGLVAATGAGSATITAADGSVQGSAAVTVTTASSTPTTPVVSKVSVSPGTASLTGVGSTVQLSAQALDQNGATMTGQSFTWSSSNTAVATVSSSGLVTAAAAGSATITAADGTVQGSAAITVAIASSGTGPATPTGVVVTVQAGNASTFQVTASWQAVSGATSYAWTTGTNSGGWSTQGSTSQTSTTFTANLLSTANGYWFCVRAVDANGNASAEAACNAYNPPSSSTGTVASVTVSPASSSLVAGGTAQLAARAYDASNNQLTGQTFTWSSSNTAVATVSSSGLVTAIAAGSATITAADGTVTGTATVAVTTSAPTVATVSISPSSASLSAIGATTQLTAHAYSSTGSEITGLSFTWNSSNTAVATVSSSGLVTAAGAGTATVRATTAGVQGSATITVSISAPPPTGDGTEPQPTSSNTIVFQDNMETYGLGQTWFTSAGGPYLAGGQSQYINIAANCGYTGTASGLGGQCWQFFWPTSTTEQFEIAEKDINTFPGHQQPERFSFMYRAPGFIYKTTYPRVGKKMFITYAGSTRITYDYSYVSILQTNGVKIDTTWDRYPNGLTEDQFEATLLIDGNWHRYTIERTPESADGAMNGRIRIWFDGLLVFDRQNCGTGSAGTNVTTFAGTFNGGSSVDQTEYFDNIVYWY